MTILAIIGLISAIAGEATGTVSLRMATTSRKTWWIGVVAGYLLAFVMLSVALAQGLPLGAAYGIWASAGVAVIAVFSRIFFKEPLTWVMGLGIVLIIVGVLLIKLGAAH